MQISGNYDNYQNNCSAQLEEKQDTHTVQQAKETVKSAEVKGSDRLSEPQDEYISSKKFENKPAGLYWVGQDEKGNTKVFFDDPNKVDSSDETKQLKTERDSLEAKDSKESRASGKNPEKPEEKCTTNTDRVDREIRKLKEKKQKLEQQLQAASGDEKKIRERLNYVLSGSEKI